MKETKTVSGTPETRAAMHEVMAAFEAFKGANDARLAELEKKASADTLLEEKVARIDAAVGSAQARLDRVLSEARRPELEVTPSPVNGGGSEMKSAFSAYMKGGSTLGLELKAGLSTAPSSGGYVVPPETERAIERRLMAGSPMREIATVRTVGAGVFRKPVSTAGVEAGWVAETAARPETDPATLAVLEPVVMVEPEDTGTVWRMGEGTGISGAPWMRVLELPPLVGRGEGGPVAAVAVEPWSRHAITAGPDVQTQTLRGTAIDPATVGVLTEALAPGPTGRWDEAATMVVRIEGRAPESRSALAVLGGANAVAVETPVGWEVIQYREATLVSEGAWRLRGLLRGQGGGDPEAEAGAEVGAAVVFVDAALVPVETAADERGLPLLWRAGARGAVPSGPFVTELTATIAGRAGRPWRPVHLKAQGVAGGLALSWIARVRTGGDGWDGDVVPDAPPRFRVRVFDGEIEKRVVEVMEAAWLYADALKAEDFPVGCEAGHFAVSQAGLNGIWGPEARQPLCEGGAMP